jgi:hypothetical protein
MHSCGNYIYTNQFYLARDSRLQKRKTEEQQKQNSDTYGPQTCQTV